MGGVGEDGRGQGERRGHCLWFFPQLLGLDEEAINADGIRTTLALLALLGLRWRLVVAAGLHLFLGNGLLGST